jgi:hypothetical protein
MRKVSCAEKQRASCCLHEALLIKSRRRPTFPPSCPGSIIGAGGLNFRVRDGNGCDPSAIATGNSGTVANRDTLLFAGTDHDVVSELRKFFPPNHFTGNQLVQISVRSIPYDSFSGLGCHSRQPRDLFDPGRIQVDPCRRLDLSGPIGDSHVRTVLTCQTLTKRTKDQHRTDSKHDCDAPQWRRRIANRVSHCLPNVWNQKGKMRSSLTAD